MKSLNRYTPLKKKVLRANHSSYLSKMLRSYLEKKYFKKRTDWSPRTYKKQNKYCSRLYDKERKSFFNGLNPSFATDNKLFWKTVKLLFSHKGSYGNNIKLFEKEEVLVNDSEIDKNLN